MRLKLFLLLLLTAVLPSLAQSTGVAGTVVDSNTGAPVAGASVMLDNQGLYATTDPSGAFTISNAQAGTDLLVIVAYGYQDVNMPVNMVAGRVDNLGNIKMLASNLNDVFYEEQNDMLFDQALLDDEEGSAQSIAALTGASDDVYYNAANYDFQPMRFRIRGYDSKYTETYINGISFNDLARGRFNYSTLGGMSRSFRCQLRLRQHRRRYRYQHNRFPLRTRIQRFGRLYQFQLYAPRYGPVFDRPEQERLGFHNVGYRTLCKGRRD